MKKPNSKEERLFKKLGFKYIAGADEVGRGAWAGPLVAAAVILPENHRIRGINDSKKLSQTTREILFDIIIDRAVAWSTVIIPNTDIDRLGIGVVNKQALAAAITKLSPKPHVALIDAMKIDTTLPCKSIVRGDEKVEIIAAASIVAKVTRDRLMSDYHRTFPQYGFRNHKGYGTAAHRKKIILHGLTPLHRRSFSPMKYMA